MLIGGLLKVIVHRPGYARSMLNCEGSGMAHLLRRLQISFAFDDLIHGILLRRSGRTFA
jgi:hypothetical protein